jgi:hypothetical protein
VKPDINSDQIHPQLRHNVHPVDGALLGAGSLLHLTVVNQLFQFVCLSVCVCVCFFFLLAILQGQDFVKNMPKVIII